MFGCSDDPLENLAVQIGVYSLNSLPLLRQMREACGRQTAYYAAFILVCLNATSEKKYDKPLEDFTTADFQDFAFFEVAKENAPALALFNDLLRAYKQDRVAAHS